MTFVPIFEDDDIIVCHKPIGIASQNEKSMEKDMTSVLKTHLYENGIKNPYIAVVHRLDKPVEGLLVYAKNPKTANALSNEISKKGFEKNYLAIVIGKPLDKKATLKDYLVREKRTNFSKVCPKEIPDSKLSVLSYELLASSFINETQVSLLKISLETGRHHQIRVQLSNDSLPLLGDHKYNPTSLLNNTHSLALCSYELSFTHPGTKKRMAFKTIPSNNAFDIFKDIITP